MPATIRILGRLAHVENGKWEGPTPPMSDMLNELEALHQEEKVTGPVPDSDESSAKMMAEEFDGEVVDVDLSQADPGQPGDIH